MGIGMVSQRVSGFRECLPVMSLARVTGVRETVGSGGVSSICSRLLEYLQLMMINRLASPFGVIINPLQTTILCKTQNLQHSK